MNSSLLKASIASLGLAALGLLLAVGCGGGDGDNDNKSDGQVATGRTPLPGAAQLTPRTGDFATLCQRKTEKQFAAPTTVIDPAKNYIATIETDKGEIKIQLNPQAAPVTVNSFVFLACAGYFEGVTFHRVLPGFVAQGGDPTGTGTGGPGYTIPDEFSDIPFTEGTLAMAKTSAPNSGGSQFFICYDLAESSQQALNGNYTVFGKVTGGMDVVEQLTPRDPQSNPNAPPGDKITRILIKEY